MRNNIYIKVFLLIIVATFAYFVVTEIQKPKNISGEYHKSQFFKYDNFISDSIAKVGINKKIGLNKVMGGLVSHHIPTAVPLLAEFYTELKNTRDVETFVIIGPDHIDKGKEDISVSKADFIMPFGTLSPNLELINKLEKSGFVTQDEAPFDREHSIDSQLLFISKLFPNAKIVPLIFRSSLTNETANEFGKVLASSIDENTFVVASVDFSHYMSDTQARPIDYMSAAVLKSVNPESASFAAADSTQTLTALMSVLKIKGADSHVELGVFNTADFSNNNDYTTGYVSEFWGNK